MLPQIFKLVLETALRIMDKAHEDSILEEARIIEAKHKRLLDYLRVHYFWSIT